MQLSSEELDDFLAKVSELIEPWISKAGAARRLEITEGTIRGYIERGEWERGVEYKVIGKTTYVHYPNAQLWISKHAGSAAQKTESESVSTRPGRRPMTRRSTVTRIPRPY